MDCRACTWWAVGITDTGTCDGSGRRRFDVTFSQTFYGVSAGGAAAPGKERKMTKVKRDASGGDGQE